MRSQLKPTSFYVAVLVLAGALHVSVAETRVVFNVRSYDAAGDGKQLDTAAFSKAMAACAAAGGGTVYVPPGRYLSGTITLQNHVSLELESGAVLLGSTNPADYPLVADPSGAGTQMRSPLIYAEQAENITLTGRGTIDGQGQVWWNRVWLAHPKKGMPGAKTAAEREEAEKVAQGRPHLIRLVNCKDVVIEHLNLRNSAEWTVHPTLCEFVRIDGVTIFNPVPSPNTDGINPESCRNVQILNCRVDVGDDCVTLKSGLNEAGRRRGRPDENITVANCVMLHGHGGVTIGSEMSGGVRNVTVANCVFQGTDIGIRIKSQRGRGGVVEAVTASNITMQDVPHPFVITTFYSGGDKPTESFPVDEGTPRYREFLFSNITARGATDAGSITGLREMPIEKVSFEQVHIQAGRGLTCTNTKEIAFQDVVIDTDEGPALILRNAANTDTARLRTRAPHAGIPLVDGE